MFCKYSPLYTDLDAHCKVEVVDYLDDLESVIAVLVVGRNTCCCCNVDSHGFGIWKEKATGIKRKATFKRSIVEGASEIRVDCCRADEPP